MKTSAEERAQAIADLAYAKTPHLRGVPAVSTEAPRSPEAIAREAAEMVMHGAQDAIDRLEPVMEAMSAVVAQSIEAQQQRDARSLTEFERDPKRMGRLVRALAQGNYREPACRIAGIAPSSLRNWMKAAEDGDGRFQAIADAVRVAEAAAEVESIEDVRSAAKDPRYWAAGMTFLERKSPERWGRRQEDSQIPRVIVQIGVQPGDVQIAPLPAPRQGTPLPDAPVCLLEGKVIG